MDHDTRKFAIGTCGFVVIVLTLFAAAICADIVQTNAIRAAIDRGAHPIDAMCAFASMSSESRAAVCIARAAGRVGG